MGNNILENNILENNILENNNINSPVLSEVIINTNYNPIYNPNYNPNFNHYLELPANKSILNNKQITLSEYITILDDRCKKMMDLDKLKENNIVNTSSNKKTNSDLDIDNVLSINNFMFILTNKNTLQQLKGYAKQYKIKVSGNKTELIKRIYTYFKLSSTIIKIQKVFRGHLQKKYNNLHGPAFKKRDICTNESDFLTIEPLNNLSYVQFFSYTDVDGFTYGFDVISLHNLILKSGNNVKNPYNRNKIPGSVTQNIQSLIKMSRILKINIDINIQDVNMDITQQKALELRILDLFQNINALGNYSDPIWLSSLNKFQLIKFIRELQDIWEFRAQLTNETKRAVCPPHGELFRNSYLNSLHNEQNIYNIQKMILPILEKLVNSGLEKDNKSLGAYYVLGALTLVNENAASTLPWLFQSVSH
jgi:hypothetical protein